MVPEGSCKGNALCSWHEQLFCFSGAPSFIACSCLWPQDMSPFAAATTVLTQPALKCSLFHSAIYESHLGSGPRAFRYFWYILTVTEITHQCKTVLLLLLCDDDRQNMFYVTVFGSLVSLHVGIHAVIIRHLIGLLFCIWRTHNKLKKNNPWSCESSIDETDIRD